MKVVNNMKILLFKNKLKTSLMVLNAKQKLNMIQSREIKLLSMLVGIFYANKNKEP